MASDELNARLRAARPRQAEVAGEAFDGALLARVRAQGDVVQREGRRLVAPRIAVPVAAAGVTFAVAGVVLLAGGPSDVGGPSSAEAITQQTLRWLEPPAGTVLHVRSAETVENRTTTRDFWQSADHPQEQRTAVDVPGPDDYDLSGDVLYDAAANTVYDVAPAKPAPDDGAPVAGPKAGSKGDVKQAQDAKRADALQAKADGPVKRAAPAGPASAGSKQPSDKAVVGDPVVGKVRMLLQDGVMSVEGREVHDGIETWKVTLTETKGRQPWTLWVSADDGKPVELYDPGRQSGDPAQTIRWSAYDVLPSDDASQAALNVVTAHPGATVSHDAAAAAAARERLVSSKDG
jgi:hypothetical protein